jgi:hypothetical protein
MNDNSPYGTKMDTFEINILNKINTMKKSPSWQAASRSNYKEVSRISFKLKSGYRIHNSPLLNTILRTPNES